MTTASEKGYDCPVEFALDLIGGKWKAVILARLKEEPLRYSELSERISRISDKMLTHRLADLARLGFVERRQIDAHSRYYLTARGESLRPVLEALYAWGANEAQN